jgi:hypothetical protein
MAYTNTDKSRLENLARFSPVSFSLSMAPGISMDLKRITRYNLWIVRVGHFWKCYGSEASKS